MFYSQSYFTHKKFSNANLSMATVGTYSTTGTR